MYKVLHIVATVGAGGAEKQLFNLIKGYDREKFQMSVICTTRGGILENKFREINHEPYIMNKKSKFDLLFLLRLARKIKEVRPDIVHTWMDTGNIWGGTASFIAGTKNIVLSERSDGRKTRVFAFLLKVMANIGKVIVCNSHMARENLIRYIGLDGKKINVIYNGIESEISAYNRSRNEECKRNYDISERDVLIGMSCRINPRKDLGTFVAIAEALRKRHSNVKMVLIGDAFSKLEKEYKSRILDEIKCRHLVDSIVLTGFKEDVTNELDILDIYVQTSLHEGLSNSIAEAMLHSKPVIATDVGGNKELVDDGNTGFIVKAGDIEAFVERIELLLANDELRKVMGENGRRKIIEHFNIQRMVTKYQELYENLLV